MSLYRCAACGSDRVCQDTQTDGIKFNVAKGVAGTVALGVGGAVAGIEGNKAKVFKCPDCGIVLTYPMPNEIKQVIDAGCMDASVRSKLKLMGMPVSWDFLLSKYKNIDSRLADEHAKKMAEMTRASVAEITEEIRSMIENFKVELNICKDNLENIDELQTAWVEANERQKKDAQSQLAEARSRLQAEVNVEKKKSEDVYYEVYNRVMPEKNRLEEENKALVLKKNSLGFFKGKDKQRLSEIISSNEKRIQELDDEFDNACRVKKKTDTEIDSKYASELSKYEESVTRISESPYENRDRLFLLEKIMNKFTPVHDVHREIHPIIAYFYIKLHDVVEINKETMEELMIIQESILKITRDPAFTPGGFGYIAHAKNGLKELVEKGILNNSGSTYSLAKI